MKTRHIIRSTAIALAIIITSGNAALADPPARVGRLSYMDGTVSFHTGDQDQWAQATMNYPITNGDALWTEPDSRAEVQVGSAEIRLDQSTEVDVIKLDDTGTQLQVPQGVVNVHLHREMPHGGVQVFTPNGEIDLVKPGSYHIDSGQPNGDQPAAQVTATVLEGEVNIAAPHASVAVLAGESAVLTGNPPSFSLQEGNATPFDNWALSREKREVTPLATTYVPQGMTGYQDLDSYGNWGSDPEYGVVWYPTATIAPDWAPYRYGHWAYVAPWGWTWVDDAAWGFAPFHYGRWVQINNRWCWSPGERHFHPVYAPALVTFIGGNGCNVSSSPAVGWVPLAPREVYHPYYNVSVDYARRVNGAYVNKTVVNNITINNIHNNSDHFANRGFATVVTAKAFTNAEPVHKSLVNVRPDEIAKAPVTPTIEHLQPAPAARAPGHDLTTGARAELPHHDQNRFQNSQMRAPETPRVERPTVTTSTAPAVVNERSTPQVQAPANQPVVPHPFNQSGNQFARQPNIIRGAQQSNNIQQEDRHDHTPGAPVVQRPSIATPVTPHVSEPQVSQPQVAQPQRQQFQNMQVNHPVQQTHIAPTPQGWQRQQQAPRVEQKQQEQPPRPERVPQQQAQPQANGNQRDSRDPRDQH